MTIRIGGAPAVAAEPGETVLLPLDVRRLLRSGGILAHILRYPAARIAVDDFDTVLSPAALLMTRALSHGACWIEDRSRDRRELDWPDLAATLYQ
ncbi:MAG: hypothetical protein JO010_09445, partial [Alphaproteobacteria bacterium]|nr:hypothetical protein [Alphaproteobacteria bacterium]